MGASLASAAQIDLRLDVAYVGNNPSAGGTWQLFAKSDESGIFALGVDLLGVDNNIQVTLPTGTVNGSDPAGFAVQLNNPIVNGRRLIVAQQSLGPSSTEQGAFYGVGTLTNGSPDFPAVDPGANTIGPTLVTLTAPQNIPWAVNDPLWATGVSVANGAFTAGQMPDFGVSELFPSASLFTSLGTSGVLGDITNSVTLTTEVRTNIGFGVATGDYNGDGKVDAADYTLWRDTEGDSVTPLTGADGNGDGLIDTADYNVWRDHYGEMDPGPALAVPEPSTVGIAVLGVCLCTAGRRRS